MSDKYDEEAEQIVRAHIDSGYLVEAVAAALRAKDEQIENWRVAASRLASEKVGLITQIDALKARL